MFSMKYLEKHSNVKSVNDCAQPGSKVAFQDLISLHVNPESTYTNIQPRQKDVEILIHP